MSYTSSPLKSIAFPIENLGIGKDITHADEISYEEAQNAVSDTVKSWLTSPLEFASFNFFAQNIPLFIVREWQRARIGWSYAERSMRFYQIDHSIIDRIDRRFYASLNDEEWSKFIDVCKSQIDEYLRMKKAGTETQDARCVIGVWLPTQLQTSANYRAIRDTMAMRLSSQAHIGWQIVAGDIKRLITEVDKTLGDNLVDVCAIQGKCVWFSKLDRGCKECEERGRLPNHIHDFSLIKKNGDKQCSCGMLEKESEKFHSGVYSFGSKS